MSNTPLKKTTMAEVAVVRVAVVICQLVFLKLYTHYTSLYELGIYYFIFTIFYSLNAFLLVPLDYFQQSQLYKLKTDKTSLKSFLPINILILKIAGTLLLIGWAAVFLIKPQLLLPILMVITLSVSTYGVTMLRGIINNLERRRQAIYTLLFETICKILILLLLVHFFSSSAYIITMAMLSGSLLCLCVLIILVSHLPEYKLDKRTDYSLKNVFSFAYPISISAIVNWVQLQSYTLFLVPFGFAESVGIFGTLQNVGSSGMNACSTVFSQLFVPNIYKTNGTYIKKYLMYAILAILFVLIVSLSLSPIIINLLTNAKLVPYSKVIGFGILMEAGNFLIGGITIYLTIHNLTKSTMKMSLLGLIVFLISFLILYLLHNINVYTLGIPMVLSQFTIAGGLSYLTYKHLKHVR